MTAATPSETRMAMNGTESKRPDSNTSRAVQSGQILVIAALGMVAMIGGVEIGRASCRERV